MLLIVLLVSSFRLNYNYKNLDGIILKELFSGNLNSTIEKAYNDKNGVVFSDESTIRQISAVKNLIYNADLPSINFSQCQELLKNEFSFTLFCANPKTII